MRPKFVLVIAAISAVCGCDQTASLLAEDTPEAALKLVEAGAPEACIHPLVTRRLEEIAREENTPEMVSAYIAREARRDVVRVSFDNQTLQTADNATKRITCAASLKAEAERVSKEAVVTYELRPVIGAKDVAIITSPNFPEAVKYVVDGSEDLIEARSNIIDRQDAERRSRTLPSELRRSYLGTLDGCDRGATNESCVQMWEVLERLEAEGWCQQRLNAPRLVEWHKCDAQSRFLHDH